MQGHSGTVQCHLVAVEGVDEASLQQVQDLDRAVTGAADQVVVGRMDGEAVDPGAVNWSKLYKHIRKQKNVFVINCQST